MDDVKAPKRIWATGDARNGSWTDTAPARDWDAPAIEYVRADLHDALTKARDEVQAENVRLRREIDDTKSFCKGISINIEKMFGPATQRGE